MITNKAQMYKLLAGGALGNTIPQFFDRESWSRFVARQPGKYPLWGIRNAKTAGDPRSRLNVPSADVPVLLNGWYPTGTGFNVSPMIDQWGQFKAEYDPERVLTYINPARFDDCALGHPWRDGFRRFPVHVESPAAIRSILRAYLWPADLENLDRLTELYPGHVIEFTACDRAVGVVEGCNTVVWECRKY